MAKTREQKEKALASIKDKIQKQETVIFVDFSGLGVNDMFDLRNELKEADAELKVAKKTIMRLAFEQEDFDLDMNKLKGEIALVFGYQEAVSPAKVVYNFSQENSNLKILGGFFENQFQEADKFVALAQTPSREELLGRLAGSLSSSLTNFVRALNYNLKGLVYTLNSIKEAKSQ